MKITLEDGTQIEISKESYDELAKAVKKPYKRWRAEVGGMYWCASDIPSAKLREDGDSLDNSNYNTGNYFKTKEEAKHHDEVLLATQRLIDAAEGFIPDWSDMDQDKWYIYNYHPNGGLGVGMAHDTQDLGLIYYKSRVLVRHVIDTMEDDLKLVMGTN